MLISQANAPVNVFIKIAADVFIKITRLIFPYFVIIIVSGHLYTRRIMKRRVFLKSVFCCLKKIKGENG